MPPGASCSSTLRSPALVPADPRLCWWAAGAGSPLQGSVATLGHCRAWGLLAEAGSVPAVQAAPQSFPRSLHSPLPATAGAQALLPEVSTWPPGGHGLEAPRGDGASSSCSFCSTHLLIVRFPASSLTPETLRGQCHGAGCCPSWYKGCTSGQELEPI